MVYTVIIAIGYDGVMANDHWAVYALACLAASGAYLFFKTYEALIRLFNAGEVNNAIRNYRESKEGKARAKTLADSTVGAGSKVLGTTDESVDPGVGSSEACLIKRYEVALTLIQNTEKPGDMRDIAWAAMSHEGNEKVKAEDEVAQYNAILKHEGKEAADDWRNTL